MPTPADQRLLELVDRWLASLELHAKYCALDAASYARIQPWPVHERPSRWIVDLARQKALTLKAQIQQRILKGDAEFSESMELMGFLANLVGAEHIARYIPLADGAKERAPEDGPRETTAAAQSTADTQPMAPLQSTAPPPDTAATGTREMPKFVPSAKPHGSGRETRRERTATAPSAARAERQRPGSRSAAERAARAAAPAAPPGKPKDAPRERERHGLSDSTREQVIADAARLVQWGRKWYELAELISSMADRPHLTEVRRILKDNKADIDKRAGRG